MNRDPTDGSENKGDGLDTELTAVSMRLWFRLIADLFRRFTER
jgi:hypothetical protein